MDDVATGMAEPRRPARDRDRWERLHGTAGAVLLGTFLAAHLATQASALAGSAGYARVVGSLGGLRVLPAFELLVAATLVLHAGYGVVRLRRPAAAGRYASGRLRAAQRISAPVVLVLLLAHVAELRVQRLFFGLDARAVYTVLSARLSWTWGGVPWIALLYVLGLTVTLFHFGNGLIAWASTRTTSSRRVRTAAVLGTALLFLVGSTTVIGVATGTRLLPAPASDSAPCGAGANTHAAP